MCRSAVLRLKDCQAAIARLGDSAKCALAVSCRLSRDILLDGQAQHSFLAPAVAFSCFASLSLQKRVPRHRIGGYAVRRGLFALSGCQVAFCATSES